MQASARAGEQTILEGEIIPPQTPRTEREFRARQARVRRDFFKVLRKAANRIPFAEDVVAAYHCATDAATPFRVRAILIGALAYFVIPIDWIPDFIAVLGFTDDITVLATAIGLVRANMRPEHWEKARRTLADLDKA